MVTKMTTSRSKTDDYFTIPNVPITDGTPQRKDVYAYLNSTRPVRLCLSCAVRRRSEGAVVTLVRDRPVRGKCEGCGG